MNLTLITQTSNDRDGVWVSGQIAYPGSQIIYWLVFLTISVLLHIVILKWINMPAELDSNDSANADSLTINIAMDSQDMRQLESPNRQSESSINAENLPAADTKEKNKSNSRRDKVNTLKNASNGFDIARSPKKTLHKNNATKTRAQALIDSAYKEIPGIVNQLEETAASAMSNEIFDLAFRKKLNNSHQKKQQQESLDRESRIDEFAEVTGNYEGFIGIRINGQCWRVPVSNSLDAFDTRIWMPDPGCTKRKKIRFSTK